MEKTTADCLARFGWLQLLWEEMPRANHHILHLMVTNSLSRDIKTRLYHSQKCQFLFAESLSLVGRFGTVLDEDEDEDEDVDWGQRSAFTQVVCESQRTFC